MDDLAVFDNILNLRYTLDPHLSSPTRQLIQQLLVLNPADRLGADDTSKVLQHQYFNEEWLKLYTPWHQPIQLFDNSFTFRVRMVKQASMGHESALMS